MATIVVPTEEYRIITHPHVGKTPILGTFAGVGIYSQKDNSGIIGMFAVMTEGLDEMCRRALCDFHDTKVLVVGCSPLTEDDGLVEAVQQLRATGDHPVTLVQQTKDAVTEIVRKYYERPTIEWSDAMGNTRLYISTRQKRMYATNKAG
jgi:hypothetical protein